jgi:hypothetical protein
MNKHIDLGNHTADLDEQSGVLTLSGEGQSMKLSADETSRLLVWLSDNDRDTLPTLANPGQKQQSSKQRFEMDAVAADERAHEDFANDE